MGVFITFEGVEGSGKTTQAAMLRDYLVQRGREVVLLREPGGTVLGEKVRELLLNDLTEEDGKEASPIEPLTELFLYEACRVEVVEKLIRPALADGSIVICDRFIDSTVAYQGYGRTLKNPENEVEISGKGVGIVEDLNEKATGGLLPDLTILVDIDPKIGLKRAFKNIEERAEKSEKKEDRFERESLEFHMRVRRGFLETAEKNKDRFEIVDGRGEISVIHRSICDIIEGFFLRKNKGSNS